MACLPDLRKHTKIKIEIFQNFKTIYTLFQMVFLFAMLWGMCSTVMGAPSRKSFSEFFRNLVDGLLKGRAKPASFKLVRTNLMNVSFP